jgi:hypothetical protein
LPRSIEFLMDVFRGLKAVVQGVVLVILESWGSMATAAAKLPGIGKHFEGTAKFFTEAADIISIHLEENVATMGKWRDQGDDLGRELKELEKSFGGLDPAIKSVITPVKGLTKTAEQLRKEAKKTSEAIKLMEKAGKDFAANIPDNAARKLAEAIELVGDETVITTRRQYEFDAALKDGSIKSGREAAAVAAELGVKYGELGEETENVTTVMKDAWADFKSSAFNSLETFYKSGLSGTKSFSDSIKSLFKDMIASILAQITVMLASKAFNTFIKWVSGKDLGLGASYDNFFSGNGSTGGGNGGVSLGGTGSSGALGDSDVLAGLAGVAAIAGGIQSIQNGNEVGGAIQVASGGVGVYNSYQGATGGTALGGNIAGGLGVAGGVLGVYNGVQQGGVEGYGSAALSAYQTYQSAQTLGWIGQGASSYAQLGNFSSQFGMAADGLALNNSGVIGGQGAGASSLSAGQAAGTAASVALTAYALYDSLIASNDEKAITQQNKFYSGFGTNSVDFQPGGFGNAANDTAAGFGRGFAGTGLSSQQIDDGGVSIFSGARVDEFAAFARSMGFDSKSLGRGTADLHASAAEVESLMVDYAKSVGGNITITEQLYAAMASGAVDSKNLMYENLISGGFELTAEAARESFVAIDRGFDSLVAGGADSTTALIASFSNFYGVASDDSVAFFNRAGLSSKDWIDNFTNNTGQAIREMADFAESGRTQFADSAADYSDGVARAGRTNFLIMTDQINQAFVDVEQSAERTKTKLAGSWNGLSLGQIAPINVQIKTDPQDNQAAAGLSPDATAIVAALDRKTRAEIETMREQRNAG